MEMINELLGTLTETLASLGIDLSAVGEFLGPIISAITGIFA